MLHLQSAKTRGYFRLKCKEYDRERINLEKDRNLLQQHLPSTEHCHEDLLRECDLTSQDTVIVRKKVEEFMLETGNEI